MPNTATSDLGLNFYSGLSVLILRVNMVITNIQDKQRISRSDYMDEGLGTVCVWGGGGCMCGRGGWGKGGGGGVWISLIS